MSKSNKQRTEYGFRLSFPKTPFTIGDLRSFQKFAKVPYMTIYKRVSNAVETGELVEAGRRPSGTCGRPQALYTRANVAAVATV